MCILRSFKLNKLCNDAEQFFLQAQAFLEAENSPQTILCRVHGITPQNRPMGSRDIHIDPVWLYDLEWIERMRMLWPFDANFVGLYFVKSATGDQHDTGPTTFHFIARYGHHEGLPVLVRQQLVAVEQVPQEPCDVQEFWAISIPSGEIGFHVVANMPNPPFWFEFARNQRIYPHLAVNGVRMRDIRQHWMPGDFLQARFLVWQNHHVLSMLVGMAHDRSDEEPEFYFVYAVQRKKGAASAQLQWTAWRCFSGNLLCHQRAGHSGRAGRCRGTCRATENQRCEWFHCWSSSFTGHQWGRSVKCWWHSKLVHQYASWVSSKNLRKRSRRHQFRLHHDTSPAPTCENCGRMGLGSHFRSWCVAYLHWWICQERQSNMGYGHLTRNTYAGQHMLCPSGICSRWSEWRDWQGGPDCYGCRGHCYHCYDRVRSCQLH